MKLIETKWKNNKIYILNINIFINKIKIYFV